MNLPAALVRRMRRNSDRPGPSRLHAVLSHLVEAALVVFGWLVLPALPLAASAIARDWAYLRHYPGSLVRIARHIAATWRSDAISRAWLLHFDPAANGAGTQIVGSCTHCGNCCLHKRCVFLGMDRNERSFCRIYGGKVWRSLPCGSYPLTQMDIDLYACPSFHALQQAPVRDTQVIPIRPLFSGEPQQRTRDQ
jgi:hypothetical protein